MVHADHLRPVREGSYGQRSNYKISMHRPAEDRIEPWLNLRHAAALVGVAPRTLRIAAERGAINALHPLEDGPWIFQRADLEGTAAQALALRAQGSPLRNEQPTWRHVIVSRLSCPARGSLGCLSPTHPAKSEPWPKSRLPLRGLVQRRLSKPTPTSRGRPPALQEAKAHRIMPRYAVGFRHG